MLPSNQQHQQTAEQQQQQQQQHLLNTVGMSSPYTATSTSYSMSYPVISGHHLNENNNLVMHPSYGKPAAHVAHQLPPASLITLQPVTMDGHHSTLHHGLGPQPPHTVTSLAPPPQMHQSEMSHMSQQQQASNSQCPSGMSSMSGSSMNDGSGMYLGVDSRPQGCVSASELLLVTAFTNLA